MELSGRQFAFKKMLKQILLDGEASLDFEKLEAKASQLASILFEDLEVTEIAAVVAEITQEVEIVFSPGGTVVDPMTFKYWIEERKKTTQATRWKAYEKLLVKRDWAAPVITELDLQSDEILELLGDPQKSGPWARRGLLLGEVQSGKTASYLGLLNKALDFGYRAVIVIGGHTNELRRQTQRRFDTDLLGIDSEYLDDNIANAAVPRIGIGKIDAELKANVMTTVRGDFDQKKKNAGIMWMISPIPTVFVIKKNAKLIANVANYITQQAGSQKMDIPLVVIDDEADWGTPNTGTETDPTRVNREIRKLLDSSTRSSYLGITATPFANIFIDHEAEAEDIGSDLFPKDYIRVLPAPNNYFGISQYFLPTHGALRLSVEDCVEALPIVHKSTHQIPDLPESLQTAVITFLLGSAVKNLRAREKHPASMLVNVSRFNLVQAQISELVFAFLQMLSDCVIAEFRRGAVEHSSLYKQIKEVWTNEFGKVDPLSWEVVEESLFEIIRDFRVDLVNGKTMAQRTKRRKLLTKQQRSEEDLRPTIFVGGDVLSRGLTLEGLQVSYFVREPRTMDTLMQMARWFGYRPGYEDLVRIWIPEQTADDFAWAAEVAWELRQMLIEMKSLKLTPKQFGLRVKTHPEGFKIVATNKSKAAELRHVGPVLWENCLVESWQLSPEAPQLRVNLEAAHTLLSGMNLLEKVPGQDLPSGYRLWAGVPLELIHGFFSQFLGHRKSMLFGSDTLGQPPQISIAASEAKGSEFWDVCFVTGAGADYYYESGYKVATSIRNKLEVKPEGEVLEFGNRRVASPGNLKQSLADAEMKKFESKIGEYSGPPGTSQRVALSVLERPRLLIYTVSTDEAEPEKFFGVSSREPLIAAAVAFPKLDPKEAVLAAGNARKYMVNSVWLSNYSAQFEGDDILDEDGYE